MCLGGCLSVGVRAQVGPTVSTTGEVGYDVTVSAGVGFAVAERTAVRSMPGFATSNRTDAAFTSTLDVTRISEELGWTAGFTGDLASTSDVRTFWLHGAALYPLGYRHRYDSGKTSLGTDSDAAFGVGAGIRAGLAVDRSSGRDSRGLFGAALVVDWNAIISD